jgi:hypothetical protein
MKKTALLTLASIAVVSPSMAKAHHHHHDYRTSSHHRVYAEKSHHHGYAERSHHRVIAEKPAGSHAHITCDMVRAYVAQVGLVQAMAMAQSAGMTADDERRAKHCLQSGV